MKLEILQNTSLLLLGLLEAIEIEFSLPPIWKCHLKVSKFKFPWAQTEIEFATFLLVYRHFTQTLASTFVQQCASHQRLKWRKFNFLNLKTLLLFRKLHILKPESSISKSFVATRLRIFNFLSLLQKFSKTIKSEQWTHNI